LSHSAISCCTNKSIASSNQIDTNSEAIINCIHAELAQLNFATSKDFTKQEKVQLVPLSTLVATTIGDVTSRQPLLALFDTGATHNFISRRVLPPGCKTKTISNIAIKTVSGLARTQEQVNLCDIKFPEFTHSLRLNKVEYPCYVIDGASGIHDIILGTGFLNLHQIDPLPSTHTIRLGDYSVPWESYAEFTDCRNYLRHVENIFDTSDKDVELFATHITPSSYHKKVIHHN
jgi:hypothetical protein